MLKLNIIKVLDFNLTARILPALFGVLGWILVAFGQPAWSPVCGVLASLCGYALFWYSIQNLTSKKSQFLISIFWFAAAEAIHLSWMTTTKFQGAMIIGVYAFVLAMQGLQFTILTRWVLHYQKLSVVNIGAISGFWATLEWARLFFICGFPFNPVGLAYTSSIVGLQSAAFVGVYGISFIVIMTNLVCFEWLKDVKSQKKILILALIIAIPYLLGWSHYYIHQKESRKEKKSIRAVLVQTALAPPEKTGFWGYQHMVPPIDQWYRIFQYIHDVSAQNVDCIILPERALPLSDNTPFYYVSDVKKILRLFGQDPSAFEPLQNKGDSELIDNACVAQCLSNAYQAQLIIGLEEVQSKAKNKFTAFASAYSFTPSSPPQIYHKQVLLPLVEYLPFKWCEALAKKFNIEGWYQKGSQAVVFEGKHRISPSICMEEMYPRIVRKCKLSGAEILVNLTNDAWYPDSKLPRQHFDHGRIRTVENGLPLLRSCNTGITCAISATGKCLSYFSLNKQWQTGALVVEVPCYQYTTLYQILGDSLILGVSSFFILLHLVSHRRRLFKYSMQA